MCSHLERLKKFIGRIIIMWKIKKKSPSVSKSFRLPEDLIAKLETLANKNDISFNQLVIQCCEYALENLDDNNKK